MWGCQNVYFPFFAALKPLPLVTEEQRLNKPDLSKNRIYGDEVEKSFFEAPPTRGRASHFWTNAEPQL